MSEHEPSPDEAGLVQDMMANLDGPAHLIYADFVEDTTGDEERASFFRNEHLFTALAERFPDPKISFETLNILADQCKDDPEWLADFLGHINLPEDFDPKELEKMFKTIEVGTIPKGETPEQTQENFRQALRQGGHRISAYADQLLGSEEFHNSIAEQPMKIKIVKPTVSQLFPEFSNEDLPLPEGVQRNPDRATRDAIYQRAREWNLLNVPPEAAPQALIQDPDENYLIGMEPITVSGGGLNVFDVYRGSLDEGFESPGYHWRLGRRWVFSRGK